MLYISSNRTSLGQMWFKQQPDGARTVVQPLDPSLHFTAEDVNSAQNVVGFGSVPNVLDPIRIRAAVWVRGQPQLLPVPNEATYSMAYGINEAGAATGVMFDTVTNESKAVTWAPVPGAGVVVPPTMSWPRPARPRPLGIDAVKVPFKAKR